MSSPLSILVIDDDPVMREVLEALLGFAGHHVHAVASGEAALCVLKPAEPGTAAPRPDVVLTDLHMPGLQGHELAERLLDARIEPTLLVGMSGSFPSEEETRLLDGFLQKPFTPEQFEQVVEAARAAIRSSHIAEVSADGILDDEIYTRLAATLAVDQLRAIYTMTLDDVGMRVEAMLASAAVQDLPGVKREAHAIKGGTGMVGATELYQLAATTEGGTDIVTLPLAEFNPACERLKRMLEKRFTAAA